MTKRLGTAGPISRARGAVLKSVAGLVLAVAFCACADQEESDLGTLEEGPLSASTVSGLKAVYAPKHTPYSVTFGSFLLCRKSSQPHGDIVLDGVDYNTVLSPIAIRSVLRTVPADAQRVPGDLWWSPIGNVLGEPPRLAFGRLGGEFADVGGQVVRSDCADLKDPENEYIELQNVMRVGAGGADVDGFTIRYHVNDDEFALNVPWQMIGCGRRLPGRLCSPGD